MIKKVMSLVLVVILIFSSFTISAEEYKYADRFIDNLFALDQGERNACGDIVDLYVSLEDVSGIMDFIINFIQGTSLEGFGKYGLLFDTIDSYIVEDELDKIGTYIRNGNSSAFNEAITNKGSFNDKIATKLTLEDIDNYIVKFSGILFLTSLAKNDSYIFGFSTVVLKEKSNKMISIMPGYFEDDGPYVEFFDVIEGIAELYDSNAPKVDEVEETAINFVNNYNDASSKDKELVMEFIDKYNFVERYVPTSLPSNSDNDEESDEEQQVTTINNILDEIDLTETDLTEQMSIIEENIIGLSSDKTEELFNNITDTLESLSDNASDEEKDIIINNIVDLAENISKSTDSADVVESIAIASIDSLDKISINSEEEIEKKTIEMVDNILNNMSKTEPVNDLASLSTDSIKNIIDTTKQLQEKLGQKLEEKGFEVPKKAITIEVEIKQRNENEMIIPQELLSCFSTELGASLKINTDETSFTVSRDVIDNEENLLLSAYTSVDTNGEKIHSFDSSHEKFNKPVVVEIKYTDDLQGEDYLLTVYRFNEESGQYVPVGGYYDSSKKAVVVPLGHFSDYKIDYAIPKIFTDIDTIEWGQEYKNIVLEMSAKGYINGRGNNFDPFTSVTRAEFAAMMVRLIDANDIVGTKTFEDVPENAWFSDEVSAAYDMGIIKGVSETKFNPNAKITREEMAVMASRVLSLKYYELDENTDNLDYLDKNNISTWALQAASQMKKTNIMSGRTDGSFDPKGNTSRLEAVIVMCRLLRK